MKRLLLAIFLCVVPAWGTTTVSGKIQNLGTGNITAGSFVRFWLRGCGGNQPRINGTSVIGPSQGGVFYFDIAADSGGNVNGTLYSTRDSTGNLGGDIECGGSKTAVWYGMQIFLSGRGGPEVPVAAKSGTTLDITQVTPITTNPVVTAPTGDGTYARIDGGNQPFLGNIGFSSQMNANAGGTLNGTFGGTPTLTGNPTISGNTTMSGNATLSGISNICNENTVEYVGGSNPCNWSGSDIGAQINSAYASIPSRGGKIVIMPQSGGGCYNFSTPIVMATVGKYVILQGASTGSNNAITDGQVCLNYTPTTATSAIDLDWTPLTGGGYESGAGMRDIVLLNNACATAGGCGSSATGVFIGLTNGGVHKALFENVKVQGFNDGYRINDSGGIGWGIVWINSPVVWNVNGIHYTTLHENDSYVSGAINSNSIGVKMDTFGGEFDIVGGSVDANTTCGISMANGAILHATNVHWENGSGASPINPAYVCGGATASSSVDIHGGLAYDDDANGAHTYASSWFQAGLMEVDGLMAISFGRVTTAALFNANTRGFFSALPNPVAAFTGGLNNSPSTNASFNAGNNATNAFTLPYLADYANLDWIETTAPMASSGLDRCYGDSTAHAVKCSYNNGTFYPQTQTVAVGTSTLTSGNIANATCQAAVTTSASGVAAGDTIVWSYSTPPGGTTDALLTVSPYITTNNVNFTRCNDTATNPIASTGLVVNWRVVR